MAQEKKSFGQLLLDTVSLIKRNIGGLASIVAIVYLPYTFLFILFVTALAVTKEQMGASASSGQTGIFILFIVLVALAVTVVILAFLLFSIAIIKKIKACDEAQELSPWTAYKNAKLLLGGFIIVMLWAFLKIALWSLLFIIPGVIFALFYSFAQMTFIFDGERGNNALKTSRDIIQPYFWEFVWKSLVVMIMVLVISLIFSFVVERSFPLKTGYQPIVVSTLENLFSGFLGVFPTVFGYFLYKDLKGRKSVA